MRFVLSAAEMRAFDEKTINEIGLPGAVLMENAGRAVAEVVENEVAPGRELGNSLLVAVICGSGNNGGDGYVIARCLNEWGIHAEVFLAAPEEKIRGDAALHLGVYKKLSFPLASIADEQSLRAKSEAIQRAPVVVDCLFGTGLSRIVGGHYRDVIEMMKDARGKIICVDVPSGVCADTGRVLGVAVRGELTISMAFLKRAHVCAPGFIHCGEIVVAEIGIPHFLAEEAKVSLCTLEKEDVAEFVPTFSGMDYKNKRGHVLAVAGSPGKRGAGRLTARGALESGAGLVTLFGCLGKHSVEAPDPVMTGEYSSVDDLAESLESKNAIVLGPGMPTEELGAEVCRWILKNASVPMVWDADALNHLGVSLTTLKTAQNNVVITPHPGEAARLLGKQSADIENDRLAAVRELAHESGAVVVLKGSRTLLCDGRSETGFNEREVFINLTGNPGMASGGTGDVLAGIIGGLLAQGVEAFDAVKLGVWIHGRCGDMAAQNLGEHSLTATSLVEQLPLVFKELQ